MGIHDLSKLLAAEAPKATKERVMDNMFGRKVAIDASNFLYSFLVSIRSDSAQYLTDEKGEVTSHLIGLFSRTVRWIDVGIRPVYVFDGKPPVLKGGELAKRSSRKRAAQKSLDEAKEEGNAEEMEKMAKRTVRITKEMTEDCKKMLRLMGIPVIEAPCEAEAQCAELCKSGAVFATVTEDMDALTLGTPVLLRRLALSEKRKIPILEVHLEEVLDGLDFTMDEFVDLCILCGCDYVDSIRGIGFKTAFKLMKKHRCLEKVLASIDKEKHKVPPEFEDRLEDIRELFKNPDVVPTSKCDMQYKECDEEGIVEFLCGEKNFNEVRLRQQLARLKKGRGQSQQSRLDFFIKKAPKKKERGQSATTSSSSSSSSSSSFAATSSEAPLSPPFSPTELEEDEAALGVGGKVKSEEGVKKENGVKKEPEDEKPKKKLPNAFALMMGGMGKRKREAKEEEEEGVSESPRKKKPRIIKDEDEEEKEKEEGGASESPRKKKPRVIKDEDEDED